MYVFIYLNTPTPSTSLFAFPPAPEVTGSPSGTPTAPLLCPDGWHAFSSSCYLVSEAFLSWSSSGKHCSSKGGHLAIITTAEEQVGLSSTSTEQRKQVLLWPPAASPARPLCGTSCPEATGTPSGSASLTSTPRTSGPGWTGRHWSEGRSQFRYLLFFPHYMCWVLWNI